MMTQYTMPSCIMIDPTNSGRIYLAGGLEISGNWGLGGAMYSLDGGATWLMNDAIPFEGITHSIAFFRTKPGYMVYGFFGGGMRYGPKPT